MQSFVPLLALFAILFRDSSGSRQAQAKVILYSSKYDLSSSQCESHLQSLNKTTMDLKLHVEHLTSKNKEMESQMSQLTEKCVCKEGCHHGGHSYQNGENWYPELCTKCNCQGSEVHCYQLGASDGCGFQCTKNTCLNGGQCHPGPSEGLFECECPSGFSGPLCEYSISRCVSHQMNGDCTHDIPVWYFNPITNKCISTTTGCFDLNSVFSSSSLCSSACTRGTCCYRNNKPLNGESMICEDRSLADCQVLCFDGEVEVVGFYPGTSCSNDQCVVRHPKACNIGTSLHWIGSTFSFGCNTCQCTEDGISCQCTISSARKEIRELHSSERQRYYNAIERLHSGIQNSVWSSFRDLYATYIMHANSPHYFLFWHRLFIWSVEKHLQQEDCSVTIPYFDFTLDSGNLSKSIVWHDDYFGGKAAEDSHCSTLMNHSNSSRWIRCFQRKLASDVTVPSMVDIAIALANKNFTEFSSYMQNVAGYLYAFVGGDMETAASPSDPVFYSIHAYIDLLFWRWQLRHGYHTPSSFPTDYPNALLIPFSTTVKHTIDLQNSLCVMYGILNVGTSPATMATNQRIDTDFNSNELFYDYEFPQSSCHSGSHQQTETECFEEEHSVLDAGRQIQELLYTQNEEFLQTLPRLCPSLKDLPDSYTNQIWHEPSENMKSLTHFQKVHTKSKLSDRFCFTADIFLPDKSSTPTPCGSSKVAVCDMSVLSACPFYPHALCKLSLCGNCTASCRVNNQDIVCGDNTKDFCQPNPCKNNGVCIASKWPTLPHLVSCKCMPGYQGEHCEQISSNRCYLPLEYGESCGAPSQRWYFDAKTNECQAFWYSGCFGNANNFPSYYDCRVACIVGACCWRTPLGSDSKYGYNEEGYDRYGFTTRGFSKRNEKRSVLDGFGGDSAIYRHSGFDYQGYDKNGFNKHDNDRFGYNKGGYHHVTRYNSTGYDRFGDYDGIIDFDDLGYDEEGYNRAGLNCYGYSRDGWDYYGLSAGWKFDCRAMLFKDCQLVEIEFPHLHQEVISFSPGKKCDEVKCDQLCGCDFLGQSYSFGTFLTLGCGVCECRKDTRIQCPCTTTNVRKEIRDLTSEELYRYQNAIKILNTEQFTWRNLTEIYQRHIPQSRGGPHFLPWHRFFLRFVEMKLQEVDCAITVPYFDWTMDVGDLALSVAWQANYFGGDGDPKYGYCVQHHPFKNHYPWYWSPCLRRQFNTSIHLPDAIHIEMILREDTYDSFRLQLETLSSLFHLFVGGHMDTPNAAYDPIFLSHYAFLDKLWYEWEQLKANGIELYPSEFRFLPLMPFGLTPDDVLLSEIQMCVSYLDVTDGAPCSRDTRYQDYDWLDKHDFLTPYNYDLDGYNAEGYLASGFDYMGFDKEGFYTDSFNRDGFNYLGFDHEGFNRYGFNSNGCNLNGFCSFNPLSNPTHLSHNHTNFNMYGYSNIGLNYHGYDAYGFNLQGYDIHNCSYFFNGPFYPMFMKQAKNKLQQLTDDELGTLERTCQPVSKVSDWYLQANWLHRKNQSLTIKAKEDVVIAHHSFNKNEIESIYESFGHWLPPTPDERFCFQLHHHSGCSFIEPPVPCSVQSCDIPMCSSRPTARCRQFGCGSCDLTYLDLTTGQPIACNSLDCRSMDGSAHEDGEVWSEDLCETCSCQKGNVACTEMDCEEVVMCQHPMHIPDVCCPICEGCEYEGQLYSNGANFVHPQNPCFQCLCSNGTVHCLPVICPAMPPCEKNALVTLNGECCPICSMCGPHVNGSHWMESPCHNCSCNSGRVSCSVMDCSTLSCQHPWKQSGKCCRSCDGCEFEGLVVQNREAFSPNPCNQCHCENGNVTCQTTYCSTPECLQPIPVQGQCCPVCPKDCKYDGKTFNDGEMFVPSFDPCMNCSCLSSLVRCQPASCPELLPPCRSPVMPSGSCCPVCPKCLIDGSEHENGYIWINPDDPCKTCICIDGLAVCSKKRTCEKLCTHGVIPVGECCSSCVDCMYTGHLVMDRMQFSPPEDPCTRCACQKGSISCTREACPQLLCRRTEQKPNSCCPVCKGCLNSQGVEIMHGHRWAHPSDLCQICTCHEGISRCERITCDVRCGHPVKKPNSCCPECHGCQYEGQIYRNTEEIPTEDPCKRCVCYGGNVECESKMCPRVSCANPIAVLGKCCPICNECLLQGKTYKDGEIFRPPSDPCYNCSCEMGVVQCRKFEEFCNPQCHHPIKIKDQCCPLCDGCEFEDASYRNGQQFTPDSNDPCKQCECLNGNVQCAVTQCQQLLCPKPIKLKGKCCGECPLFCSEDIGEQVLHREGDVWPHSEDKCQICMCKHSVIRCEKKQCPVTNCSHPATPFGECCPRCDYCEFTRKFYDNGQEFPHADDPCLMCVCQNGTVTCVTLTCDPLSCRNPVPVEGHCCPVCLPNPGCHHLDMFYEPWETFTDPEQPCMECMCAEGVITCHKDLCPGSNCPNPVLSHCCESCDGCSYGDRNYMNNMIFEDPYNSCRLCHCDSGVVSCQQKPCPQMTCSHPIMLEMECCPICRDCIYQNKAYGNGETFLDPRNPCLECHCQYPNIHCQPKNCPEVTCSHPVADECCKHCLGCMINDNVYQDDTTFSDPNNTCHQCTCQKGNVHCQQMVCPSVTCSHPVQGECCKECQADCLLDGVLYKHWQVFVSPHDPCQECTCRKGSITCKPKKCPLTKCKHPSDNQCCPSCTDCFYKNEVISNGETVNHDGSDVCRFCHCQNGNVKCQPHPCPIVRCTNPIMDGCCPVCHLGCLYSGKAYNFGAEFDHPSDPCSECACMDGSVYCDLKPCKILNCVNPVTVEGQCCPECPAYCIYHGVKKLNGETFADLEDSCNECRCLEGTIQCSKKACSAVLCKNPAPGKCCLECEDCQYLGKVYSQNSTFDNPVEKCEKCFCKQGDVMCQSLDCPSLDCPLQKVLKDECCPVCVTECHVENKIYEDGDTFTPSFDKCRTCTCVKGQVVCKREVCIQCTHPVKVLDQCCPSCDGCSYNNISYINQQHFTPLGDPCEECICKFGTVMCHHLSCSQAVCDHPVFPEGECCPVCPGCIAFGIKFDDGKIFTNPENPCEECICVGNKAACEARPCFWNCTDPVPDPCCPVCEGCFFEDDTYENGEEFHPDSCRTCTCKDGSIYCTSEECPYLNCSLKTRIPGECCEVCRGCIYEGSEYENGANWVSATNPCISCQCEGGTVLCSELHCLVPCTNPKPIPGRCCPICLECKINGKVFQSGEVFVPDDSPCDTCSCDSGELICVSRQCPSLADCPRDAIKPPGSGECCSTCAGFSSSCTKEQIGHLVQPSADPCFLCQCEEDFSWVCSREICPSFYCPEEEIIHIEVECCSKCKVCAIEESGEIFDNAATWISASDLCSNCTCEYGVVKCSESECDSIKCGPGEIAYRPSDRCCDICLPIDDLACHYGEMYYENGQNWNPEPCILCHCSAGKVNCQNQRCVPLNCPSDEIPSVDPGKCCPKCIPRPATCVAFGDPHYRTFDGKIFHFQGTCRYVLTADCFSQRFLVIAENNDRGFKGVSWTERIVLALQNTTVDLRKGPTVYVKGRLLKSLPYFDNPVLYIEKTGSSVLVTTDVGVKILWNGDSYVEVVVSGVYRGKTCGLCGNFNNYPEDDMRLPSGQIVTSEAKFGNSWKNHGAQPSSCTEAVNIEPCSTGGYRARRIANIKCAVLKESLFEDCHSLIAPEPYFASCVYDVCACSENDDCLCDILTAYSQECAKTGIILHWRSAGFCDVSCSEEEGLVFDECGPPCPRTCENKDVPMRVLAEQCFKPCVPGCQCSADKVLHNGCCVNVKDCPS